MDTLQQLTTHPPVQDEPARLLVEKKNYRGFVYYIVFYMHHPCAYVKIPKNNKFFGVDCGRIELGAGEYPHRGFTYSRDRLYIDYAQKGWYLGWDYAHIEDYSSYNRNGHLWSIKEIRDECQKVIRAIIRRQEKEAKCIDTN